jgi:hypothetical protein
LNCSVLSFKFFIKIKFFIIFLIKSWSTCLVKYYLPFCFLTRKKKMNSFIIITKINNNKNQMQHLINLNPRRHVRFILLLVSSYKNTVSLQISIDTFVTKTRMVEKKNFFL